MLHADPPFLFRSLVVYINGESPPVNTPFRTQTPPCTRQTTLLCPEKGRCSTYIRTFRCNKVPTAPGNKGAETATDCGSAVLFGGNRSRRLVSRSREIFLLWTRFRLPPSFILAPRFSSVAFLKRADATACSAATFVTLLSSPLFKTAQ